jgi:hypothetical protein
MVSINFFAIVATLLATTVISKPLTQSSDKGATAGEPTYCKIDNIDKDFEQHLTIGDSFKRTKPKKEKSNDDNGVNIITIDDVVQFNSTVEYDKVSTRDEIYTLIHTNLGLFTCRLPLSSIYPMKALW